MRYRFGFRVEKVNLPYHVVTVTAPWRRIPYILEEVRDLDIDVRKAWITKDRTTLYLKDAKPSAKKALSSPTSAFLPLSNPKHESLARAFDEGFMINEWERAKSVFGHPLTLPHDTSIMIYNIPTMPITVLEFTCQDRVGLLCDMLDCLSWLPVDVQTAHISTVSEYVPQHVLLGTRGSSIERGRDYVLAQCI